jgi:hypothetical protein
MQPWLHTAFAAGACFAAAALAHSVATVFGAMYEGTRWPPIAEITIRHGIPVYLVALPFLVVVVTVVARLAKRADAGAVLCHMISLLGLLCLAYAAYYMVTRTTFQISDVP